MITKIFSPLRWGVIASLFALGLLLVAGCGGSQQSGGQQGNSQEESAEPVAASFVGEVPDTTNNALVALLVDPADEAGEPTRRVRAYLCDGQTIFEWFWGSAEGNELALSSSGGAQLEGSLAPDGATGTITLANGENLSFQAPLATGFADLYEVNVLPDGSFDTTSERGGHIQGQIDIESEPQDGLYPLAMDITAPEGETVGLDTFVNSDFEFGQSRWIVSADGQTIKGTDVHPIQRKGTRSAETVHL